MYITPFVLVTECIQLVKRSSVTSVEVREGGGEQVGAVTTPSLALSLVSDIVHQREEKGAMEGEFAQILPS